LPTQLDPLNRAARDIDADHVESSLAEIYPIYNGAERVIAHDDPPVGKAPSVPLAGAGRTISLAAIYFAREAK
jgi:hypothetical protein